MKLTKAQQFVMDNIDKTQKSQLIFESWHGRDSKNRMASKSFPPRLLGRAVQYKTLEILTNKGLLTKDIYVNHGGLDTSYLHTYKKA